MLRYIKVYTTISLPTMTDEVKNAVTTKGNRTLCYFLRRHAKARRGTVPDSS